MTFLRALLLLIMPLAIVLCSCSDDGGAWQACPDYYGVNTECRFVDLPLNYSDASSGTIQGLVFRVLGSSATKKGQVWFLQGGPGDSNYVFANIFRGLRTQHPDWDYYSLEHRGVGNSTRLTCAAVPSGSSVTSANAAECVSQLEATWGDNLSQFTTTNAARDMNTVVEMMREPRKKVFIYGLSYGTYWLHRYLQLYPEKVDGFVFDSICPAADCHLDDYDSNINDAARQVMELCAGDTTCQTRLSAIDPDPWTAMGIVYDRIDAGTICDELKTVVTRSGLRYKLATLAERIYGRALIPAAIYRIDRCNSSDVAAIGQLLGAQAVSNISSPFAGQFVDQSEMSGPALGENIILSELWDGISVADAQSIVDAAYASEDLAPIVAGVNALQVWPTYTDDYIGKWGNTDVPVLMMNSNIDGQTPYAWAQIFAGHFTASDQYLIEMPDAAHGTAWSLFMADDPEGAAESCGSKIMFNYIENPTTSPDTSCLSQAFTLGFDASTPQNQSTSTTYFGTADMWD